MKDILFTELMLNETLTLKNRLVMAPMTRSKAADDASPTEAMAAYYARRAAAGLIITEGTLISDSASGYPNVPGLYTAKHIDGWREVTRRVHDEGGLIFSQLWHTGRVSHPSFLDGALPLAPSETTMTGPVRRSKGLVYGKSRAATLDEITTVIKDYKQAAINAIDAGFDGIELHGANGYLIDQFLHYHTNAREDRYGGSSLNMARFALEVVDAVGEAIGFDRISLRLTPGAHMSEMQLDPRDRDVFIYLLKALNIRKLAYVHVGAFDDAVPYPELDNLRMSEFIRRHYKGSLIGNGSYHTDEARARITKGAFDLISIGSRFIANPDLVEKVQAKTELVDYDKTMLENLY